MTKSVLESLQECQVSKDDKPVLWVDRRFEEKYPELYILMTMRVWKGRKRQVTKLSIFTNRGVLKVSLYCPTENRIAYVSIFDFMDLFGCVERCLSSGGVDWQPLSNGQKASRAS